MSVTSGVEGLVEVGDEVVDGLDADRQPHERGSTASGEPATDAWVMRAGCSMSDSTAPSDSASVNSCGAAATTSSAAASPPAATVKDTMPPKSRICCAGDVVAGMVGRAAGRARARPPGGATSSVDDRPGVGAVAVHAHAERLHARAARGSSRTAPAPRRPRSAGSAMRSASSSSFDGDEAADDVGVAAEVLGGRVHDDVGAERRAAAGGTAWRTCCRRRRTRAALVGELRPRPRCRRCVSSGLVGVSTHTSAVSSGHAAASASRSVRSTARPVDAGRCRAPWRSSRNVPP